MKLLDLEKKKRKKEKEKETNAPAHMTSSFHLSILIISFFQSLGC